MLAVGPITTCGLVRCVQTHGVDDDVEGEDVRLHVLQDLYNAVDTREKRIRTRVEPILETLSIRIPFLYMTEYGGARRTLPS
jgi:hypothetical protein